MGRRWASDTLSVPPERGDADREPAIHRGTHPPIYHPPEPRANGVLRSLQRSVQPLVQLGWLNAVGLTEGKIPAVGRLAACSSPGSPGSPGSSLPCTREPAPARLSQPALDQTWSAR